jgi:hypothetical protein
LEITMNTSGKTTFIRTAGGWWIWIANEGVSPEAIPTAGQGRWLFLPG